MESFPTKHPDETFVVEIDFKKQTTALTGASTTIEPIKGADENSDDVLVGLAVVSGTKVQQRVAGGVAGLKYKMTFTALNGQDTWVHEHILPVGINQ